MPNITAGLKIVQVQLKNDIVQRLDEIQDRTYVPRATLLRMAVEHFIAAVDSGQVTMGISLAPSSGGAAKGGTQPTFTQVPPPPPVKVE